VDREHLPRLEAGLGALQRPTIRTPVLASVRALLAVYRRNELKSQCDLVAASR
jgi:hypothetical protein